MPDTVSCHWISMVPTQWLGELWWFCGVYLWDQLIAAVHFKKKQELDPSPGLHHQSAWGCHPRMHSVPPGPCYSRIDFIPKTPWFFIQQTRKTHPALRHFDRKDLIWKPQRWHTKNPTWYSTLTHTLLSLCFPRTEFRWVNGVVRFGSGDPLLQSCSSEEAPVDDTPRWNQDPCRNRLPKRTGIRRHLWDLWGCCHMGYEVHLLWWDPGITWGWVYSYLLFFWQFLLVLPR